MTVRPARYDDIPRILEICEEARRIMRADGNTTQWTGGYPSEEVFRSDIERSVGYVVAEDGYLVGYFAFIPGVDRTYLNIYEGQWLNDTEPYGTIHRLASTVQSKGVAGVCFDWCWSRIHNLRVDTHKDNNVMRHCIEKYGFKYCGIIYLLNGDPRLAFQKFR